MLSFRQVGRQIRSSWAKYGVTLVQRERLPFMRALLW